MAFPVCKLLFSLSTPLIQDTFLPLFLRINTVSISQVPPPLSPQPHKAASLQIHSSLRSSPPVCTVPPQLHVSLPPITFPPFHLDTMRRQKGQILMWWLRECRRYQMKGAQHRYSDISKTLKQLLKSKLFWTTQSPACVSSFRPPRSTPEPHFPVSFSLAEVTGRVTILLGPSSILHAGGKVFTSTCPLNITETQQMVEMVVTCYREYIT